MRKLCVFDLDGTLCDTVKSIAEGMNRVIEEKGCERIPDDIIKTFVGSGVGVLATLSYEYRGLPIDEESINEAIALFRTHYENVCLDVTPYNGVREILTELKSRGVLLGVYSNKPDRFVRIISCSVFGENTFAFTVGQTERPRKPDPTVLLELIESVGSSPENTVYVGDSDIDVLTALNAETELSAVSWGYRSEEILRETGASFVTTDPEALLMDIKKKLEK